MYEIDQTDVDAGNVDAGVDGDGRRAGQADRRNADAGNGRPERDERSRFS